MIVKTYDDDDFRVHTLPLIAMGVVIAITLALAISTRFGIFERQANPDIARAEAGAVQSDIRTLTFHDAPDGSIWVADGATGQELARYGINEGGFVRSTARAVITPRLQRGIGPETPFELVEWSNGSMTLRDPETGRGIELASFGDLNHSVYVDILKEGRQP
ncbi:MAG: photosynthetic complex assembly protein PuhC [Pseudomonadota bacterium]